jgi:hypothetical protein
MNVPNTDFTLAGTLEELKAKGRLVVHGSCQSLTVSVAIRPSFGEIWLS